MRETLTIGVNAPRKPSKRTGMVELMKEPSEGMKVAGWNALKPSADDCLLGAAFEAMSAELLKEVK